MFIGIIGALLAAGILQLRGTHGWFGWQWVTGLLEDLVLTHFRYLFLIEGVVTLAIGIFAAFYMPPSPTQTAGHITKKSWFSEREETIMVTRVLVGFLDE